ncbi:MAG: hypothetical protein KKG09_09445 [Verrucomicrobia bacterium]|nr:hypothetical protein [Verrucomicrobiota bacterium]MBU4247222.1 hypothetical protein [Verrucomicrobiota bacterium]MBU4291828.1 hypothetical protein [Verrucomicrobiota bacterium]MBU4498213.1 hypothetical protein [Verrucomicrobiota bacterium]MCG2678399.1 hypothetical protein [Kiritimatiellia bacterium]
MNIADKYQNALTRIPPPGGNGCHPGLLGVATLGILAGQTDGVIAADIRQSIPPGRRQVPDREIDDAIRRARMDTQPGDRTGRTWIPPPKPQRVIPCDGRVLAAKWIARGRGVSEAEFWEVSPVRPPEAKPGPEEFCLVLANLYQPTDLLFIGDRTEPGTVGQTICTAAEWIAVATRTAKAPGPYIIPNPLDGCEHDTKSGTRSRRCDAAVVVRRFVVVEFDGMTLSDQLSFWWGTTLPVAVLIHSGNKSYHAWIRIEGAADPDETVRVMFDEILIPAGADSTTRNPARLSRVPGHWRADKHAPQRLIYLDPHANPKGRGA